MSCIMYSVLAYNLHQKGTLLCVFVYFCILTTYYFSLYSIPYHKHICKFVSIIFISHVCIVYHVMAYNFVQTGPFNYTDIRRFTFQLIRSQSKSLHVILFNVCCIDSTSLLEYCWDIQSPIIIMVFTSRIQHLLQYGQRYFLSL